MLSIKNLSVHYGGIHALRGISLDVPAGKIVTLIGANGAGKSTTLNSIMGLVKADSGLVSWNGKDIFSAKTKTIVESGIVLVPEGRRVFPNLSVDENLRMGEQAAVQGATRWTAEDMFDYFPRLKERRNTKAGSLSGGEQQMLTICRSLLGNPLVILIDEPTEGLAPKVVATVAESIKDMQRKGVSVVLVEQKLAIALKVSSRVCVMGHGRIVFEGTPKQLVEDQKLLADWLAV